ncbi:MAG: tetratricopeptide repeat protein [Bryobacteraceae bacterium]
MKSVFFGPPAAFFLIFLALAEPAAVWSQPPGRGRQAALIERGLKLMDEGRYREAANILEEAWENDPSDASLAENLAICLLDGRKDEAGAFRLMREAILLGGKASVNVDHIHEKAILSGGVVSDTCKGRLSFQKDRLSFVSSQRDHSFSLALTEVKGFRRNRMLGLGQGGFRIETVQGQKLNLCPSDWSDRTTELIFRLWNLVTKE